MIFFFVEALDQVFGKLTCVFDHPVEGNGGGRRVGVALAIGLSR